MFIYSGSVTASVFFVIECFFVTADGNNVSLVACSRVKIPTGSMSAIIVLCQCTVCVCRNKGKSQP